MRRRQLLRGATLSLAASLLPATARAESRVYLPFVASLLRVPVVVNEPPLAMEFPTGCFYEFQWHLPTFWKFDAPTGRIVWKQSLRWVTKEWVGTPPNGAYNVIVTLFDERYPVGPAGSPLVVVNWVWYRMEGIYPQEPHVTIAIEGLEATAVGQFVYRGVIGYDYPVLGDQAHILFERLV